MKRNHKLAMGALGVCLILTTAQMSKAVALVTIDGTDELNIERGTPTPGHSPTVQFAFTFGPVTALNSADAGATFPGPVTDFIYTGGNTASGTQPNGGIGFGINSIQASALDFYELNV